MFLRAARRALVLRLEVWEVRQAVAQAEGGAVASAHVRVERVVARHVDVLVSEERARVAELARELRVKGRGVEDPSAGDESHKDELVQRLVARVLVDDVARADGLVDSRGVERREPGAVDGEARL